MEQTTLLKESWLSKSRKDIQKWGKRLQKLNISYLKLNVIQPNKCFSLTFLFLVVVWLKWLNVMSGNDYLEQSKNSICRLIHLKLIILQYKFDFYWNNNPE